MWQQIQKAQRRRLTHMMWKPWTYMCLSPAKPKQRRALWNSLRNWQIACAACAGRCRLGRDTALLEGCTPQCGGWGVVKKRCGRKGLRKRGGAGKERWENYLVEDSIWKAKLSPFSFTPIYFSLCFYGSWGLISPTVHIPFSSSPLSLHLHVVSACTWS